MNPVRKAGFKSEIALVLLIKLFLCCRWGSRHPHRPAQALQERLQGLHLQVQGGDEKGQRVHLCEVQKYFMCTQKNVLPTNLIKLYKHYK